MSVPNGTAEAINAFAESTYQTATEHGFYPTSVKAMWKKVAEESAELIYELMNHDYGERCNIGEEAADVIITVLNVCKALDINIGLHMVNKAINNESRPYRHEGE